MIKISNNRFQGRMFWGAGELPSEAEIVGTITINGSAGALIKGKSFYYQGNAQCLKPLPEDISAEIIARENFGKEILRLRNGKNITQKELASLCGWSPERQSAIENGKYNLTLRTIVRLMIALECSDITIRASK